MKSYYIISTGNVGVWEAEWMTFAWAVQPLLDGESVDFDNLMIRWVSHRGNLFDFACSPRYRTHSCIAGRRSVLWGHQLLHGWSILSLSLFWRVCRKKLLWKPLEMGLMHTGAALMLVGGYRLAYWLQPWECRGGRLLPQLFPLLPSVAKVRGFVRDDGNINRQVGRLKIGAAHSYQLCFSPFQ